MPNIFWLSNAFKIKGFYSLVMFANEPPPLTLADCLAKYAGQALRMNEPAEEKYNDLGRGFLLFVKGSIIFWLSI
jgi:hypothetical protein